MNKLATLALSRKVGGSGGVSSWNDLTDKPFGEVAISNTIEWDGNTEGRTMIDLGTVTSYMSGAYMVHVSDAVLTREMCSGIIVTGETPDGAQEMPFPDDQLDEINGGVAVGTYIIMSTSETTASLMGFTVNFEKPGTYFFYSPAEGIKVLKAVFTTECIDNVSKLDEKYIPNTIARTSQVQALINNSIDTAIGGSY